MNTAQALGAEYVFKKSFRPNLRLLESRLCRRSDDRGRAGSLEAIARGSNLSPRQQQVLAMLAQGLSYDDVADLLGVAVDTVKCHVSSILDKTGAGSTKQLCRRIFEASLEYRRATT